MRDIASEFRMWPPIWKAVKGGVATMMSLLGLLTPFLRTGIARLSAPLCFAAQERIKHQEHTKKNCMTVRVTGIGSAVKIAFEDVFERIEVAYQTQHSIFALG